MRRWQHNGVEIPCLLFVSKKSKKQKERRARPRDFLYFFSPFRVTHLSKLFHRQHFKASSAGASRRVAGRVFLLMLSSPPEISLPVFYIGVAASRVIELGFLVEETTVMTM